MKPYGLDKLCSCCHYTNKGKERRKGREQAQEEHEIKFCCNFCTSDIVDVDGRSFCPAYCFEKKIGSSPYNVTRVVMENAANSECEECEGKGHVECDECCGNGWVTYESSYGVGEEEWSPKAKKRGKL